MGFSLTSGDARGLGLLLTVCACAVGLRGNALIWMRGTWGVFWRSAHVPTIPFTWLRRAKALGQTAHASNHHATRCLPMNAYVLYPMQKSCTLIGRKGSREESDDVPHANETRDPLKQYPYCLSRALIGYRPCRPCSLLSCFKCSGRHYVSLCEIKPPTTERPETMANRQTNVNGGNATNRQYPPAQANTFHVGSQDSICCKQPKS